MQEEGLHEEDRHPVSQRPVKVTANKSMQCDCEHQMFVTNRITKIYGVREGGRQNTQLREWEVSLSESAKTSIIWGMIAMIKKQRWCPVIEVWVVVENRDECARNTWRQHHLITRVEKVFPSYLFCSFQIKKDFYNRCVMKWVICFCLSVRDTG